MSWIKILLRTTLVAITVAASLAPFRSEAVDAQASSLVRADAFADTAPDPGAPADQWLENNVVSPASVNPITS